jgi:hypothetical protein
MRNASYPHSMSLSMYYHLEKTVKELEKTVEQLEKNSFTKSSRK